jgi:hypothetical protein
MLRSNKLQICVAESGSELNNNDKQDFVLIEHTSKTIFKIIYFFGFIRSSIMSFWGFEKMKNKSVSVIFM